MEIDKKQVYDFLHRLGYKRNEDVCDCFTDHINKLYNKETYHIKLLMDTIFYYTPPSILNLVKYAIEKEYNKEMCLGTIMNAITKSKSNILTKYREIDLIRTLHPWLNKHLIDNLDLVLEILISKALDSEDNYFNIKNKNISKVVIEDLFKKYENLLNKAIQLNLTLSGSTVLAYYGTLYREKIKDFDFVINANRLDESILKLINNELTTNKLVGKRRLELENKLKKEFMTSSIGQELQTVFGNELELIACMIDRISTYDYEAKATFIFKWRGIEFDLLFIDNINSVLLSYKNTVLNIQDINDVFYAKRLLGRPKDFQDLINFIPKQHIDNTDKLSTKLDNIEQLQQNTGLIKINGELVNEDYYNQMN